jgi:predicted nuclease of predicted toxin-antitoxin system
MRIYADENVWKPVVTGLRRRGWDISSVFEEGTTGDSDREHIERAAANDWIVLTFDDDFLSLAAESAIEHAGIIYIEQYGKEVGELVQRIDATLRRNEGRDLTGEVVYA